MKLLIWTDWNHYPFQYGPVIKLQLQILPSMHDQLYGIDQSATVANQSDNFDTAFSQGFS